VRCHQEPNVAVAGDRAAFPEADEVLAVFALPDAGADVAALFGGGEVFIGEDRFINC
jgi:hypothetical protein